MPAQRTMTATQALEGLALPMLTGAQANGWMTDSKEEGSNEEFGNAVRDPWA